ncbi:hypothetical protein F4813DRAFT_385158 [Daldinia decipiens]|uniref:uncharacterized protein n=1 Tax=Daldinia decipiens TaxID=326647 RepID=UPI0020C47CF4|nr:uncharacterized protein F4813DRAFT_385158 [Daldinia decipiens]KAI1662444.1 hypothetical protein F4813DRAFT_385158 [Daldinia decipiens]
MQFGSLATLLAVFAAATTAMPGVYHNAERGTQMARDMPTAPDGYFHVRGNLLQSIGGDGQILAEREIDARDAEDLIKTAEAKKAKRELGMLPATTPFKREACSLNQCSDNADCYQWTDDSFLRCTSGQPRECDGRAAQEPRWWQFWKSSEGEPEPGPEPTDIGKPPDSWLDTDIQTGLSSAQVEEHRRRYNWNELVAEKENMFAKVLSYFQGPILYVMELAALLAVGLGDWIDFGVIIGILCLNAFVGFYQEKQAADVVASLKGDIAMKATVIRDGKDQEMNNEEDDDESIHYGELLVACDQSAITGESLAVDKYMGDILYYTTGCKRGKAFAIMTTSAKYSFVGRTAALVQGAKDQGHFKAVMDSIGTSLLVLVMFWILVAWIGGFLHHLQIATPDIQNLLHYTLVLLIIGVPVGLPVVTTTTLAGVNVLCSDKTGTLTANKLSIREPFVAEGQDVNWMMAAAALASSHNIASLDPIDKVTITTLKRYPKAREILREGWVTDKLTPFDPVSKRITTECRLGNDRFVCAKGGPRTIVTIADVSDEVCAMYNQKAREFAARGFRSLGVACKMLRLGTKVYNSEKLIHSGLTGTVQHDLVQRADGFAEVFPEHKY